MVSLLFGNDSHSQLAIWKRQSQSACYLEMTATVSLLFGDESQTIYCKVFGNDCHSQFAIRK